MRFVLRMWWREVRSSWARLGFFFLCVGIGVAAIIVLRSVVQDVRATLTREARSLVGADLVIQSPRPLAAAVQGSVNDVLGRSRVTGTTALIETQTMVSAPEGKGTGQVKLVELRGIEAAFPFYGRIELENGATLSHDLVSNHGAVAEAELLVALGVSVGDELRIAGQTFTVRGAVTRDRVQRGGIAFGSRVYVDLADLKATTLLGFGSRASYQLLVRLADDASPEQPTEQLRTLLTRDVASVRSWQTLEDRIGDNLSVAENYLSLVGFAIVVLGGIGVWSVTRVIVQQKIKSVAILKCIGATSGRVLTVYVLQVLSLAACGSVVGLAIAAAVLRVIPASLLTPLGVSSVSVTWSAAAQGLAVGLLVSLLFALVPLLEIRKVKPLVLFRAGAQAPGRRLDWKAWGAIAAIGVGLAVVAMWQAHSVRAGAVVTAGLAVIAASLDGASRLLVRLARRLSRSRRFAVRHAVVSMTRPGNQSRVVLMAVGVGCFFVLGVRALQANLLDHLANQVSQRSPDFVAIDIQPDQVESLKSVVGPYLRESPRVMPLMRGRVVAVAGSRIQLRTREDVRDARALSREFGLTFRDALEANEKVIEGAFWTGPGDGPRVAEGADTEVSVERETARNARLTLGDVVTFDIAGQMIAARITSVRSVVWEDSQSGGFVFVLRPGAAVSRMAHTFVGFLQVQDDSVARGSLQRALVKSHPNVSIIDVRDVLASIREVVGNVTLGVTIVGAVTLVSGVLILIGAVAMTKFQRLYDAAIYRTLGASSRLVAAMVAAEYAILGALAGALGAAGALGLSWVLARYLFDIDWQPATLLLSGGVLASALTVSLVGVVSSLDVVVSKPLATLKVDA